MGSANTGVPTTATAQQFAYVQDQLVRLGRRAWDLHRLCLELKRKGFSEDVYLYSDVLDRVAQHPNLNILRGPGHADEFLGLLEHIRTCKSALDRLQAHLEAVYGPRDRPPPDLSETPEIRSDLAGSSLALRTWMDDVLDQSGKKAAHTSPPPASTTPAHPDKTATPDPRGASSSTSPLLKPKSSLHKKSASYGGGPLPKMTTLDTGLKPRSPSASRAEGGAHGAAPKPFQATVEDVSDAGEPEDADRNVHHDHMTRPDLSTGEAAAEPYDAAAEPNEASPKPYGASPKPCDAASKPDDVASKPYDAAPKPYDAAPKPYDAAPKPYDAAPAATPAPKGKQRETGYAPLPTPPSSNVRPRHGSTARAQQPSFHENRPNDNDKGFLSPSDAIRRNSAQLLPLPETWAFPQGDFALYPDTDEDPDGEPLSPPYTPKDMPSPRARGGSSARSPLQPDVLKSPRGPALSPRYISSPRPSPRQIPKEYSRRGDRPSPRDPSVDSFPARRHESSTPAGRHRYSASADFGGESSAVNASRKDANDVFDSSTPGRSNAFERQFRASDRPKSSRPTSVDSTLRSEANSSAPGSPGVRRVEFTLEELFHGATHHMRVYSRSKGISVKVPVAVAPGSKPGSIVKFSNVKADGSNNVVNDLCFVIQEKPHERFTRKGDDLYETLDVPLADSLCGWQRRITCICGSDVRVGSRDPTPPRWMECYAGLGMPKPGAAGERGDLYIGINVVYPAALSEEKKQLLKDILKN